MESGYNTLSTPPPIHSLSQINAAPAFQIAIYIYIYASATTRSFCACIRCCCCFALASKLD